MSLKMDPKRRGRVVNYDGKELWKLWRPKIAAMSMFIALDRIKKANDKLKAEAAKNPKPLAAKPARGGPRGPRGARGARGARPRGGPRGGPRGRVKGKAGGGGKKATASNGLRNVHWDKVLNTEGTIWGDSAVLNGAEGMDELFGDIGEEFAAKKSKAKGEGKTKSKKPKAPEIITDGKRVQNISIMMSSLSHHGTRSLAQIAECVRSLNAKDGPFQLSSTEIEGLMKAIPTMEDQKNIKAFIAKGASTAGTCGSGGSGGSGG